ncbi:MAG: cation diffusion facilitator family transporter [Clostridia bacterium]|nr:cation diffusion facilitator family transporter [Clostridia bacterium]
MREKEITKTGFIGIGANILLSGFKAVIGLVSGSIAIVLDAVNNLTDVISSVITIVGLKLAKRKPDSEHPFGHGKIEYFSAIIVSGIVISAGVMSMIESIKKIINPNAPEYNTYTLVIISAAVIVKLLLGRYFKAQGLKYNSAALTASGSDALFDAVISFSTLLGAAVTMIWGIVPDGWLGGIISVFIIKAGIEMLFDSVSSVIGKTPDSELAREVKETIAGFENVLGVYDLMIHNYGPNYAIGSVHIEIPAELHAYEIHALTKQIQQKILDEFKFFLTVGIYAIDDKHEAEREKINAAALAHENVFATHGIFIDDKIKLVYLDVLIDFAVEDREKLKAAILAEVSGIMPGYRIEISFDTIYSG